MAAAAATLRQDIGTDWPRRVCVVSEANPYITRAGSTEYLHSVVAALGARGVRVDLLVLHALRRDQLRDIDPTLPGYLDRYATVRFRGALRRGRYLWATDPLQPLYRLHRQITGWVDRRREPYGWLPPPVPAEIAWAGRQIARLKPDLVLANYFNAAAVFAACPPGVAKAILVHDVMALRAESCRTAGVAFDVRPSVIDEETAAFRTADLCLAIKDVEAAHIRAVAAPAQAAVVPFTLPGAPPGTDLLSPRPPVAVFVAAMTPPNADGLIWLLESVWPLVRARRPDARLRVIGKVAAAWDRTWPDGAEAAGFVDDLAAAYAGAALALTPLRFGSGVKIKVIEALAHGLPVVSTPVGAEGMEAAGPEVLHVADDAAAFAAAMVATLDDPRAAARRTAARAFAEVHHGPAAVARALDNALPLLCPAPSRTGALELRP